MRKVAAIISDLDGAGMFQHDRRFRLRLKSFDCGQAETSERELKSTQDADEPISLRTTVITWIALAALSWALVIGIVVTLWRAL